MTKSDERFRAPRLVAMITVALSDGVAHYVVDTENLSSSGLCLCPRKLFPVGTKLHLMFGQPPELPAVSVNGIVRWYADGKGVGVEFTEMSEEDRRALTQFVNSQTRVELS